MHRVVSMYQLVHNSLPRGGDQKLIRIFQRAALLKKGSQSDDENDFDSRTAHTRSRKASIGISTIGEGVREEEESCNDNDYDSDSDVISLNEDSMV